jgi:hypothetical protein
MRSVSEVEREIERLADLLPAYLCERTGLSMEQVVQVLDAQEAFWDSQPHVVGHMIVLGFEVDDAG